MAFNVDYLIIRSWIVWIKCVLEYFVIEFAQICLEDDIDLVIYSMSLKSFGSV